MTASPPTNSRPWRVRRCPSCREALYAGELIQVDYGSWWLDGGPSRRRCPRCSYTGTTRDFRLVRDAHKQRAERAVTIRTETPIQVSVYEPEPAAAQLSFALPVSRKVVD